MDDKVSVVAGGSPQGSSEHAVDDLALHGNHKGMHESYLRC